MAVTNPTTPATYNFSKNFIPLRFLSDNYLEQTGITAINNITFSGAIAVDSTIAINFGQTTLTFTAKAVPDDSGLQFPSGSGNAAYVASILPYFTDNSLLSTLYDITVDNLKLVFTAKKQAYGLDFVPGSGSGYAITNTAGRPAIQRTNFGIRFVLFCQTADHSKYEIVHSADLQLDMNSAGVASVDVSEYLNSYLEKDVLDIPDTGSSDPLLCKKSCRKFYYTYAESWGQPAVVRKKIKSAEYTILAGGLSFKGNHVKTLSGLLVPDVADAAKDRFLKQGSSHQYTRKDQPQFLYFFNTRATQAAQLRVKFTYLDGQSSADITVTDVALTTLSKVAFNVTHDQIFDPQESEVPVKSYQVWLETAAGVRLSETRTYYLNYKAQQFVRYFVSWSSWGALDTRLCYGKATSSLELVQQEAKRILKSGDDIKKGNSTIFDVKLNNKFKVSTGHIDRSELILNRDFYLSPHKFRYTSGLFLPIKVTSKDIPELSDGETRFYQEFEYEYRFTDDVFTEGDVDEPGLGIEGFFFNSVIPSLPSNGIIETDPTVPSWVKAITVADINKWNLFNQDGYNKANWDLAYSWGNHNTMGYALSTNHYDKTTSDGRYIQNRYDYQADARLNVKGGKFLNYLVLPIGGPSVNDLEEGECAIYFDTTGLGGGGVQPPVIANFPDLGDVDISGRLDGYEVYWNQTASKYMHRAPAGSGVSSWNDLTDKPTTISGFGITDAYTEAEIQSLFSGSVGITGYNKTNWDTAYGWGNHAGLYRPLSYVPSWSEVTGKPTVLSAFTNDLGNYGGWITGIDSGMVTTALGYTPVNPSALGSNAFSSTAYLPLTAGFGSQLSGSLYVNNGNALVAMSPNAGVYSLLKSDNTKGYFGTATNHPLSLITNDITRYTIDVSGNNTWTGNGTFGGEVHVAHGGSFGSSNGGTVTFWGAVNIAQSTLNVAGALTGTSANFGSAAVKNWLGGSAYARFGHKDVEASYYGLMQHSSGDVYLKGLNIYLDSPVSVTSLLTAPKIKANTLLTIPPIAPNVNDMANGEVAIWAEGFN